MTEKIFCSHCGQEVDLDDEFCFNCGSAIKKANKSNKIKKNSLNDEEVKTNDANKNINQYKDKFTKFYNENEKSIKIGAIALCLILILSVVAISLYDPYKYVGTDFLEDPVVDEKVQFEAVYMGTTSYFVGSNHNVVKVNDTYLYISGMYFSYDDIGHRFLLKGTCGRTVTKHPFNGGNLLAKWFYVEDYERLD